MNFIWLKAKPKLARKKSMFKLFVCFFFLFIWVLFPFYVLLCVYNDISKIGEKWRENKHTVKTLIVLHSFGPRFCCHLSIYIEYRYFIISIHLCSYYDWVAKIIHFFFLSRNKCYGCVQALHLLDYHRNWRKKLTSHFIHMFFLSHSENSIEFLIRLLFQLFFYVILWLKLFTTQFPPRLHSRKKILTKKKLKDFFTLYSRYFVIARLFTGKFIENGIKKMKWQFFFFNNNRPW